tara:strand:- start:172 stop:639 length:468 start_codon:yes stop_codon:yes gene_type:complete
MSKVIIIENICDYIIEFNNNSLIVKPKDEINKKQKINIEPDIKILILSDETLFIDIDYIIKKEQNIGLILNHFIKKDKLTRNEFIEIIKIRDYYKSEYTVLNLNIKVSNPWIKQAKMKYGNIIVEKEIDKKTYIILTDSWRFIMNCYKDFSLMSV